MAGFFRKNGVYAALKEDGYPAFSGSSGKRICCIRINASEGCRHSAKAGNGVILNFTEKTVPKNNDFYTYGNNSNPLIVMTYS